MIATEIVTPALFLDKHIEIRKWCYENIAQRAQTRDSVWEQNPWFGSIIFSDVIWHFAKSSDATMFALKWL